MILDPAPDAQGGKESWVELALEVDWARQRAVERRYRLPVVPMLPRIYFAYGDQAAARFEVTPALGAIAKDRMAATWSGASLQDLGALDAKLDHVRDQAFAALTSQERQHLLREAWEAAWIAPQDPSNSTGLWLLPHELCTEAYAAVRAFEYFGDLVGGRAFNVARKLEAVSVRNPAVELARQAGFDLAEDLACLAYTEEGSPEYQAIEERLFGLVPAMRKTTGASSEVSDQELLNAVCEYGKEVVIAPALASYPETEQIRRMRQELSPRLSQCCTDADLLSAVQHPNSQLWASGLCQVQTLHRDVRVPLEAALRFSSAVLGRERVEATFWYESQRQARKAAQQTLVAA
jgi:hypothetical protein